ncbi:hypothetical protein P3C33_27705 [Mesorhizobium sp. P16.1]|uniref:hypothetical protein n=1 Tax=unclassified Mesorhizobium TaxID=325217 RepID=UPI0021A8D8E4|nr:MULTISPECIES: hypothetical protein [unclassified Mesorhizobium]MCT2580923.1 hypothetical protein [Mesorhizobium sp. P13.3]MDF3169938.1 hypothetical protein [Mesorhizobium sp. P16.1]MDF3181310.1 hypothetical protein [Mesorhizobium sp. P17.1]MDF3186897.1 hypothetical protein [Mesorhizobium sp. ICCV3110.1]
MDDEGRYLGETLAHTVLVIEQATTRDRARICSAFDEATRLIGQLAPAGTPQRPGIEACILQFERLKQAQDFACAGWILAAISARVDEHDLPDWKTFKKDINTLTNLLDRYRCKDLH